MKSVIKSPTVYVSPILYALNLCLKQSFILLMMKPAKSSLSKRIEVIMVYIFKELKNSSSRCSRYPSSLKSYILSTVSIKMRKISSISYIISSRVFVFLRNSLLRYLRMIYDWRDRLSLLRNRYRSGVKSCFTFRQKRTQFYSLQTRSSLKFFNSSSRWAIYGLFQPTNDPSDGSARITQLLINLSQLFRLSIQSEKSRKRQLYLMSLSRYLYLFSGGIPTMVDDVCPLQLLCIELVNQSLRL